ncbi:hypothetical protein MMC25_007818 [Agyrium rufum]|nr:hypothetical protein [Agyrium rufum]
MAGPVLPPAQPTYVLRGHGSQVYSVHFLHKNLFLLTGDAEGWVILWSMPYKRPYAVWRAHEQAILGIKTWADRRVITHGRDHKLIVWQLDPLETGPLSKILPVEKTQEERPKPWIEHILDVNTMNFCSFAMWNRMSPLTEGTNDISALIAVPNMLGSEGIDVFHLPSEIRRISIPAEKNIKTGMVMTLSIHKHEESLVILAGYESGHTIVYYLPTSDESWQNLYLCQPHTQPVLSLAPGPIDMNTHFPSYYITSSADALVVKHPVPSPDPSLVTLTPESTPLKSVQTKHSGQQSLHIRSDGKIFATAGWDNRIRIYSTKTIKELAVLKWHQEGCMALDFANVLDVLQDSKAFVMENDAKPPLPLGDESTIMDMLQASQLDEKITVLSETLAPVTRWSTISMHQRREETASRIHWLAAGSKDGKVSLWDIY